MRHLTAALALTLTAAPLWADGHETTITSHGISAFGELKYAPDFTHFDYVNPDAPKGGTISYRGTANANTFDSLNYFILTGEPAQGITRIYDTLLARAYDDHDAVYGLLAESIVYPEDRSWVIYTLRDGATFKDGHPVTAEDVVFTVDTIKADGSPRFQIRLKDIESATAISDREVRVDFAEGASTRDLISAFGQFPIIPAHYYEDVDFTRSTLEPPLGSGPYVVDTVDPGRSVTYCRNPDYWGAELPVNVGKDNFECIKYEYFADRVASFEALKAGDYLFHEENFSAQWGTAYDFPALEKGWVIRETIADERPSGAQGYWFNLRRPQFEDPRVRQAIGMMFNFEWSNRTLFYGLYDRTDSFWENSDLQADGLPVGAELAYLQSFENRLPASGLTQPAVTPLVSGERQFDRATARAAGALLDEAGWPVDDDGMRRNADGETLKVTILSASPAFERINLPFIDNLQTIGVEAGYEFVDYAQYEERTERFEYDIIVGRFALPLSPSIELRNLFSSESANAPGTFNLSGLEDPVIDEMIAAVIAAEDRETLTTRVRALDRVLRDRQIWAPQWYKGTHWLAYWDVFGRPDVKPTFIRGIDYWWWDEAKYQSLKDQGALR